MALTNEKLRTLLLEELQPEKVLPDMEVIPVPEWKKTSVRVRVLGSDARDRFEQFTHRFTSKGKAVPNFRAEFLCLVLCDEKGNPIFGPDDVRLIGKLPSPGVHRVFDVAQKLNKLDPDAVEEAEKNSESATGQDSGTSSPRTLECPSDDVEEKSTPQSSPTG